jgi:3-hydroxybutyryl-CoA dehydrogenase
VGVGNRPGIPHLTPTLSAPQWAMAGGEGGEARRANFIGTHYFSPASRMKLVEVIPAFDTAPETIETAMRLMREADKVPIRVKDVAGFAVNRMLLAFLNEAVRLVDEGVATPEDIDTAAKLGLGHPMGADGRDDLEARSTSLGNPLRSLRRTLPPPPPALLK